MLLKNKSKRAKSVKYKHKCRICKTIFYGRSIDKYCSDPCRKKAADKQRRYFKKTNPDKSKEYNTNRLKKNPNYWKDKARNERLEIIQKLGGKCCVCPINNPVWLHIDFIPTMRGTSLRHPRHKKWVLKNLKKFRLLCANHHYELTLTGKIKGTNITQ